MWSASMFPVLFVGWIPSIVAENVPGFDSALSREPEKCPLDYVCFALDESSSINSLKYEKEKGFVMDIALEVEKLSPDAFYSAVAFASQSVEIVANTQDLRGAFTTAIENRTKTSGSTNIGSGLNECFKQVGRRAESQRVIILMSDGVGFNFEPAVAIKNAGVAIVTVGIGKSANVAELRAIASKPQLFIKARDFSSLGKEVLKVTQDVCLAADLAASSAPTPSPTPSPGPSSSHEDVRCAIQHVCFAMDESGSISPADYEEEKSFVTSTAVQIGSESPTVSFSAWAFTGRGFRIISKTRDLHGKFIPAIKGRVKRVGRTNLGEGLARCLGDLAEESGRRVIVLISDGVGAGADVAAVAKQAGVAVVTVGIGRGIDVRQLQAIATKPRFFIGVSEFRALSSEVTTVTRDACEAADQVVAPAKSPVTASAPHVASGTTSPALGSPSGPSIENCEIENICFAIDESGSISRSDFITEKDFVLEVAQAVESLETSITYSAFGFSDQATIIQGKTNDLQGEFAVNLGLRKPSGGRTNIGAGLVACFNEIKDAKGNGVIVLLSDGRGRGTGIAAAVKRAGVAIVCVGIGKKADAGRLGQMASEPRFYVAASGFDTLGEQIPYVAKDACEAGSSPPRMTDGSRRVADRLRL